MDSNSADAPVDTEQELSRWKAWALRHQLTLLIIGTIVVTIIFTGVGLNMYHTSGAAQLDLSRPGYERAREIVREDDAIFEEYPATGTLDRESFLQFKQLLEKHRDNMNTIDAFGGDPMALDALGIDEPVLEEE